MQKLKASRLKPNTVTYNALISACGKAGEVDQAMAMFKEMQV